MQQTYDQDFEHRVRQLEQMQTAHSHPASEVVITLGVNVAMMLKTLDRIEAAMATKGEVQLLQRIVFGMVGIIVAAVVWALLKLVVLK